MVDTGNYKTIKQVASLYKPIFSEAYIRHLLHRNINGINSCVLKIGGKVLIDMQKFEAWFKSREKI